MVKTYSKPKLAIFGEVEDLTKGVGIGSELLILSKDIISLAATARQFALANCQALPPEGVGN